MNLEHVAKRLLARVKAGVLGSRIENGRMLFEATTGIDCRSFYNSSGILQPLSAAAILEDFLLSGHASQYPVGVRCFFGHVVPK